MSNSTIHTAEYEYYSHFLEDILTPSKNENDSIDYYKNIIKVMNDLRYKRINTNTAANSLVLLQMMYHPSAEAKNSKPCVNLSKNEEGYLHELFKCNLITLWYQ